MKLVTLILLVSTIIIAQQSSSEFPKLTGPYLGQKPPGMTAELFAPGIVSTGYFEHSSPVFTPDLTEIYWSTIIEGNGKTVLRPTYYMKIVNGVWSKPQIPSFGKNFLTCENPFISPDGKRLYFSVSNTISPLKLDLYYVDRVGDGWSEPTKMDSSINTPDYNEGQLTISNNGTIYFIGFYEKARTHFGLYSSKLTDGKHQKPVFMEEKFNSLQVDWTPYIAPDESYFIFCSFREGGFGAGDLYICFKEKDGSWGKVINMGDKINTDANDRFPNVTPDGKYLFFNSTKTIQGAESNSPGNGKGDIYWIDAKIMEELKLKK
jgi:Tol biopolymer transport system component